MEKGMSEGAVNSPNESLRRASPFRVRPRFLAGCAVVLFALILPDLIMDSHVLQRGFLLLAAVAIFVGWGLLAVDRPKLTWRTTIALIAAVYLVASLPVFLFEMSPVKWFVISPHHDLLYLYARPWLHWGRVLFSLGIICSLFGRGRARILLATGAVLLWAVWTVIS
jgi:hypothetical protein